MAKLPEAERPPLEDLLRELERKVSQPLRKLFVLDIQNDCACPTETYDCGLDDQAYYLSAPETVRLRKLSNVIPCPMLPDISDQSLILLLQTACQAATDNPNSDIVPVVALANPRAEFTKLIPIPNHVRITLLDFVPMDTLYLLPEPEFFGAISTNIAGYGAFCFPKSIIKYRG